VDECKPLPVEVERVHAAARVACHPEPALFRARAQIRPRVPIPGSARGVVPASASAAAAAAAAAAA